jgi:hypothetical protein
MSRKIQPENKYTVGVWRINQKYYPAKKYFL